MRRLILIVASAIALAAAIALGPLGAAASAPYVYGCTMATYQSTVAYYRLVSIYNSSATTANLTHKLLAGNGTIRNGAVGETPPITSSLPATHTKILRWVAAASGVADETDGTTVASVRIVSNVPVVAVLSHEVSLSGDYKAIPITCSPQQP